MKDFLWLEILVIIAIVAFFGTLIGVYIYKRVHHLPTGECACCASKGEKKKNKLVKSYNATYKKEPLK